ncbi:DUF1028 domain-containing protein [Xanthocytophaga agilis]|uniref:DUF1028 domain-containing protein n=1 Tax=Xanthocytophaga agilis TaxID=3048010 RepID=A0AAE3R6W6_9BACT|nr:DUF1028 domain-containing protein [Xanthocytophaga agilis]MDJ1504726.1 DUF1028 domain-containing protein [Xanthocytophaga agilis]
MKKYKLHATESQHHASTGKLYQSDPMRFSVLLACFLSISTTTLATWSIIIVDPVTKEIGIAGASCTYNCYGIGQIIPGKGAIIVQAMSNKDARRKGLNMIEAGASPEKIIAALHDPLFDPEKQQYAVVTLSHLATPATYTGAATHTSHGTLTAAGVSVQGNTLASEEELKAILDAVIQGQQDSLRIDEILMRALEAGSTAGGDKRCGEQRATSAFLMVAKPTDKRKPYLVLQFFGQKRGGLNAVSLLRGKYERWKSKHQS